jgi:hypothetical protein
MRVAALVSVYFLLLDGASRVLLHRAVYLRPDSFVCIPNSLVSFNSRELTFATLLSKETAF